MLSPHPHAALEYWFFKVNAGPTALLVDWIARRRVNELWLRVSIHSPNKREVLLAKHALPTAKEGIPISLERTTGQIEEVSWALDIDCKQEWIAPDIFPARLLSMTDLALVSAPRAVFTGQIRHGKQQIELQQAPGLVSHYWGRQLSAEWWWVSANQFDRDGVAVECAVIRSALWGIPVRLPLAYLYLRYPEGRVFVTSPPARARVEGSPEGFEIKFQRIRGETITLSARGRDYGDLGDGIINTLVGDLEIRQGNRVIARAQGTAGLERRVS